MGNTYGILLITVLMGNGLVGLPRRMWYYADTEGELNLLYMMVTKSETADCIACFLGLTEFPLDSRVDVY
jgi:hypothetical protein